MRSSLDYAGLAQLCGRSPIMHKIMRVHNRIIPPSLHFCQDIIYSVRAGVPVCDILCVYCTVILSVLEYACPVWLSGLTKKLSKDIEQVQTLFKAIVPNLFIQ